ncbi:MAG TPA: hypothetical protein VN709_11480 [Terriglobales bacterium]|nr:hypothetical protein [Terriglobales bacterium]
MRSLRRIWSFIRRNQREWKITDELESRVALRADANNGAPAPPAYARAV